MRVVSSLIAALAIMPPAQAVNGGQLPEIIGLVRDKPEASVNARLPRQQEPLRAAI